MLPGEGVRIYTTGFQAHLTLWPKPPAQIYANRTLYSLGSRLSCLGKMNLRPSWGRRGVVGSSCWCCPQGGPETEDCCCMLKASIKENAVPFLLSAQDVLHLSLLLHLCLQRLLAAWLCCCTATRRRGCAALRLRGCAAAARLCGGAAARRRGCAAARLCCCAAARLRGGAAARLRGKSRAAMAPAMSLYGGVLMV